MASDLQKEAKEAFIDDHFQLAADLYTQAISFNPNSAELFADRAQANIKLANLTEAVADANKAIALDPSLAKTYLRKGIACLKLEEYQTAKAALETGAALAPEETRFIKLIKECDDCIAEETCDLPNQALETPVSATSEDVEPMTDLSGEAATIAPSKPKYRHEFYQKPEEIVVTILARGIPADHIAVEFGKQILSVSIDVPGEDEYQFQPRLFGMIIPDKCKFLVLSTKVEIRLAKAEATHWASLEFDKEATIVQRINASPGISSQRPTYPSSKPRRVDWDKLEAEVKKEEKEEKLDGDAALNKFFREIYHDADDDTRKAMRKSFVESNGTVLSTNWKEVGYKKVEGSPPDGMEMKKWEY